MRSTGLNCIFARHRHAGCRIGTVFACYPSTDCMLSLYRVLDDGMAAVLDSIAAISVLGCHPSCRAEQLRELYLHFAAVNAAPAHITANSEALALWVQELACRAYSMHVVASSLKGWKLLGPDGQAVQPGLHGAALQLLQQLLLGEPGNCGQGQAAVGTAAAAGGGRGSKAAAAVPALVSKGQLASAPSKSKKKHKLQQGQQQGHDGSEVLQVKRKPAAAVETGSSKKKAKTSMAGAAAAELAVEAKQVAKLLKQQVKTPKQPQQQHAAKTKQQADMPTQQQQQQARTPKQQARTPLQHQRQPDSAVVKKKKKSSHDEAAAPAAIPGKKVKAAAAAAAKQTILFQTPQAPKAHKKVAKPVKRRLSDPR